MEWLKDNKKILNVLTLGIIIVVPFLKFLSMNLEGFGLLYQYDSINPATILYAFVPVLLFIYIKDIIVKKRKLDIYDYLFYVLFVVGVISSIFAFDIKVAIFGKELRHEGFLSIISYYLLFINWKVNGTSKDINKYIKIFIILAIVNSVYGLLQIYTPFKFILRFSSTEQMATGLCGNPNFFGSLIVTVLSIVSCKFLIDDNISFKKILLMILLIISLINSQSTGPIFTFMLVIIFLIVLLKVKKQLILKNLLILLVIILTTFSSIYFVNKYIFNIDRCELCDIDKTIETGGNGRLEIWKNSLDIVKDYPIVGVGFDNFYLAYPNPKFQETTFIISGESLIKKETEELLICDNAHNVYLQTLVSTGILGFIPYLLLCLLTLIKGLKSKNKQYLILLSGFVAYSIQAFTNISVIQVAPIYYIIIGLILSNEEPKETSYIY